MVTRYVSSMGKLVGDLVRKGPSLHSGWRLFKICHFERREKSGRCVIAALLSFTEPRLQALFGSRHLVVVMAQW